MASKLSVFLAELKRRKVYRVAAIYAAVGVAISLGIPDLFGALLLPDWTTRLVIVIIVIGFPIALVLAWAYEIRPEVPADSKPSQGAEPGTSEALDPPRKSIAVLPFANRSGLAEDLHFTDGIHDQIISQLHKVGSLSVRGRTSVEVYRDSPKNLRTIGQELNARYLMEGGVQRAEERVRIIVQLIDAHADEHMWVEEYDRFLSTENLFDVQSEIALRVVSELKTVLTPEEEDRIKARPTENLEAYEAFLRGRQHMNRQTGEGILQSMREFERAIELDPGYAQAHSALANAYIRTVNLAELLEPSGSAQNYERAKDSALKALELDPKQSEAHVVLAIRALQWEWDWKTARTELLRAIELNPSDALAYAYNAVYLMYKGRRPAEAQEMARRAKELDPFDPFLTSYRLWMLWAAGEHRQVLDEAQKAVEVWPEKPFMHYWAGHGLLWTNHPKEAIQKFETAIQLGGRMTFFLSLLGGAYGLAGNVEEARKNLVELEERAEGGANIGRWIASIYAALGEGDEAMRWLSRGVDEHDPGVFHAMTDPFFREYWEDPRFLEVMNRIGLGPSAPSSGRD